MDYNRAQEIIQSPNMVHVNYHGIPVYIQSVDPTTGMATVFPLDNVDHEQPVDLNGLFEG